VNELLISIAIGSLIFVLGVLIWKKQMIGFLHSYHYSNVSSENKKAYTTEVGIAHIIISMGIFAMGILNYVTETSYGWVGFALFFIPGFFLFFKAQKKYNGGLF